MKTLLILLSILILGSCVISSPYDGIDQYLDNPKPMTKKEQWFIDSLKNINIKARIVNPYIGLDGYGNAWFDIFISYPDSLTVKNKNSILDRNRDIAKFMYKNVIEDSCIYDFYQLRFNFTIKHYIRDFKPTTKDLFFLKDSLEKWCGFKVIKTGKCKYKRVKI